MTKTNSLATLRLGLSRLVTLTLLVGVTLSYFCAAQTPVIIAPLPQLQFFDQSGRPLAFGCVFTYQNNSVTPLATYTDWTGTTQNSNPVILSGGGSGNIWIQAGIAYSFRVKSFGGSNCASGSTLYTVNGIGGGISVLTTVVPYSSTPTFADASQNQLFEITLTGDATSQPLTAVGITPPGLITWQITQDGSGGHAFTWPTNTVGGCTIASAANSVTTQMFVWNGVNATAIGPCVTGQGPAINIGTLNVGTITSLCANPAQSGFIRLCKTDAINWRNNANSADQGLSVDTSDRGLASFAGGLVLNGTTPNLRFGGTTSSFPMLKQNSAALNVRLADDSADAALTASTLGLSGLFTSTDAVAIGQAPAVTTPSAPVSGLTWYAKAGHGLCAEDQNSVEYCMAANAGLTILSHHIATLSGDVTLAGAGTPSTLITQNITMPTAGCPCRALVSYQMYITGSANGSAYDGWVTDGTVNFGSAQTYMDASGRTGGFGASAFSEATYANSAIVTFTLKAQNNVNGNVVAKLSSAGAPQNTWMSVDIVTSN